MNSLELTGVVTVVANVASCNLTTSELALVAGIFVQPGDTPATIAAQRTPCEKQAEVGKE